MEKIKKTVIFSGYSCNNACVFCINSEKRKNPNDRTTGQIIQEMINARSRGRTYLEIIGGELTIRPDIITLIKSAKKLGFETIAMATNGRMLSYPKFASKLVEAGITDIIFSIHGHNYQVHDSLTRSQGSFKQLMEGLSNIKRLGGINLCSNTTIVRQNYKKLKEIGRLILNEGIKIAEFIFADPTSGGVYNDFKELMPKISEATPYIHECLDLVKDNQQIKHWHVRYVPVCYFLDYQDQISEICEKKIFLTEHIAPDFQNFDVENSREGNNRIKPRKCKDCKYYMDCEGIWREYLNIYGDKELTPVIG